MTFTDLEKAVMLATFNFWNYGNIKEMNDNAVIFSAKDISEVTKLPVNIVKGVMGSLHKKGMFYEFDKHISGISEDCIQWVCDNK